MSTSPTYVAVVDDDQSVCRSFARLLRSAGIQPITYASAEALIFYVTLRLAVGAIVVESPAPRTERELS